MVRWFVFSMLLVCVNPVFGQLTYTAPDLRASGKLDTYLGWVNPHQTPVTVVIKGYGDAGQLVAEREVTLAKFAAFESASRDLFENGSPVWVQLETTSVIAPYVRYEEPDGNRMSMVALNTISGGEAFVSQLVGTPDIESSAVVLVNTAAEKGGAQAQPFVQGRRDETPKFSAEALALPGFGDAFSKTIFTYESNFDKEDQNLFWDRLTATGGAQIAGLQHFGDLGDSGQKLASIALPRTSYRDMMVTGLHEDENTFENQFVLVNNYPGRLPVLLTAYFEGSPPQEVLLEMDPGEKRILNFNTYDLVPLPTTATWYRITPHEGGLTGFQLTRARNGKSLAASEAYYRPGAIVNLPFTPGSDGWESRVGLINPSDLPIHAHVAGFNAEGRMVAYKTNIPLEPFQKKTMTTASVFGDKAARVTWVRAWVNTGKIAAYSLVGAENGKLAAFQGVPVQGGDFSFFANFEHFEISTLEAQNWTPVNFNGPEPRFHGHKNLPQLQQTQTKSQYHYYYGFPAPGNFFMETQFLPLSGILYLGYEPIFSGVPSHYNEDLLSDKVGFLSPFFEVPNYQDFYLSYFMRFINPEYATKNSEYGLVYREEGSDQWHWFGLKGILLLDPPLSIGDCWEEVYYRSRDETLTGWLPFEIQLPSELRGKRIQVGMYYHHLPTGPASRGPNLFMENIKVSAKPLYTSNFFKEYGTGQFTFDITTLEQDEEEEAP